ncbi:MAG: type II secretion system F family protein [Nocardioides sp.]
MVRETLPAVLCGIAVGAGLFVAVLATVGVPSALAGPPRPKDYRPRDSDNLPINNLGGRRLLLGLAVGLVVLASTQWVVAACCVGLLAAWWDRVAGSSAGERAAIERLDALASWTESLRDTIAGAIGLEQAIPATAVNAAPSIKPSLNLLVDRLRVREPMPDALRSFAEDLRDPSADIICASLLLNSRLRGPGLRDVLTALATSTREELDMRRRIEASRRSIRRSVRIVLIIVLGMMGMLSLFNKPYVAPYDSWGGQLVLAVIATLFMAGLVWLRSLAVPSRTDRFLVFNPPAAAEPERVG